MSNRQERRKRHETHLFVDEHGARQITPMGQKVEITGQRLGDVLSGAALDDTTTGQHLWVSMAVFRVARPDLWATEQQVMDSENLVMVTTPGCYTCEVVYSPEVASEPCPGEPT